MQLVQPVLRQKTKASPCTAAQQSTAGPSRSKRQASKYTLLRICICNQSKCVIVYTEGRYLNHPILVQLTLQCLIPYCLRFVRQENCASVCVLLSCRGPWCACARSSSQQGTATAQAARPREPKLTRGWGASRRSSQ